MLKPTFFKLADLQKMTFHREIDPNETVAVALFGCSDGEEEFSYVTTTFQKTPEILDSTAAYSY